MLYNPREKNGLNIPKRLNLEKNSTRTDNCKFMWEKYDSFIAMIPLSQMLDWGKIMILF